MKAKICIADGIDDDSLVGQTVYFKARRTIRTGSTSVQCKQTKGRGSIAKKPFYDLIPGTVVHAAPGRLGMEAAGGIYSRTTDDVVLEQDLAGWIIEHPGMWVMQGGVP